jgi:hypothetical protein
MPFHLTRFQIRLLWAFCLCSAMWFALGGTIKVLVAASSGKTIEMVVCTGAGMKKIYVPISKAADAGHETAVKHCSNTPLALPSESFDTLQHLAYAPPSAHARWHISDEAHIARDWLRSGKPPPGRAPPLA